MDILGKSYTVAGSTIGFVLVVAGVLVSPFFFGLALIAFGLSALNRSKSVGYSGIGLGVVVLLIWCGAGLGERAALRDNAASAISSGTEA